MNIFIFFLELVVGMYDIMQNIKGNNLGGTKLKFKKFTAVFMAAVTMISSFVCANTVFADAKTADLSKPYIALGADLKSDEKATVLQLLGVTESDLANYTVATVTNKMEHEYLDQYLSQSLIGSRALSSVKVEGKEDGNGVKVTTKNISYCTEGMYQNALVTAGVENADVTVVGPYSISGTAALVGAMEAYENMTGKVIDESNADAATNELVVTSDLGDTIGDQDKAEELVGAVKDIVVSKDLSDEDKIEDAVDETAEKLEISLSDEDKQQIIELMEKISKLDLDVSSLQEQAKALYNKLSDLNIDLGISQEEADGFFAQLGNYAKQLWDAIKGLF